MEQTMSFTKTGNILSDQVQVYISDFCTSHPLGPAIPMTKALRLLNKVHNTQQPQKLCMHRVEDTYFIQLCYSIESNRGPVAILKFTTFFVNRECPKHHDIKPSCLNCITCIKQGKCHDKFIRNTFGEILFPEHYAPQKQR